MVRRRGTPYGVETVLVILAVLVVLAIAYALLQYMRRREHQRTIRREKLDGVVAGHREMADAHAGSLDELRPAARSHRQAAVDHTRKAEELEERIEREERHARFHAERAKQTESDREQV